MQAPNKIAKIALAAALTGAIALPASAAFAGERKTQNTLLGAGLGALAGAARSHGDAGAPIAGAVAGGLIGNVATKDRHYRSDRYDYRHRDRYGYGYGDDYRTSYRPDYRYGRDYRYDRGYRGYETRYDYGDYR